MFVRGPTRKMREKMEKKTTPPLRFFFLFFFFFFFFFFIPKLSHLYFFTPYSFGSGSSRNEWWRPFTMSSRTYSNEVASCYNSSLSLSLSLSRRPNPEIPDEILLFDFQRTLHPLHLMSRPNEKESRRKRRKGEKKNTHTHTHTPTHHFWFSTNRERYILMFVLFHDG